MAIYLVRHGEVENPGDVVYADLPGFDLSRRGADQAEAVADYLAPLSNPTVVSSPLERALSTAASIADRHGVTVTTDPRLTEWNLTARWAGNRWTELPTLFPGQLEAYLAQPTNLAFAEESLQEMAERVAGAVAYWVAQSRSESIVFVSHQDPIHGAIRLLTGSGFADYHRDKPEHCSVSTLHPLAALWEKTGYWAPGQ